MAVMNVTPIPQPMRLSRLLLALTILAAAMLTPVLAEARNRTNDELRRTIFGSFTDSQMRGRVSWYGNDDLEIAPGVYLSIGGFSARGDGRSESFFTAQIFNSSAQNFCLRVRQKMASGPFVGRLRLDNSGKAMLVEPRGKAAIATYTAAPAVSGRPDFLTDAVAWNPNPAGSSAARCSSVMPSIVNELAAQPVGKGPFLFTAALRALLAGRPIWAPQPSYRPGTSRAAVELIARLRRAGVTIDPAATTAGVHDYDVHNAGPIQVSSALALRAGEMRALSWLHNGSSLNLCAAATISFSGKFRGSVSRSWPSTSGFYLPAGSGRALTELSSNILEDAEELRYTGSAAVWDAPAGVTSNGGCAASINANVLAEQLKREGIGGAGKIADQMRP